LLKRNRISALARLLLEILNEVDSPVHRFPPWRLPPRLVPEDGCCVELHPVARVRARESFAILAGSAPAVRLSDGCPLLSRRGS
jgi:hypothetical protein